MSFNSAEYWENRYKSGNNSGSGSYNRLALFKADILNEFIETHRINSVVEFGHGDGNQLSLAKYPKYVGYDVSETIVEKCKEKFAQDENKEFRHVREYKEEKYDLSMSLDVLYHLIEPPVFENYIKTLFSSSNKYVAIYSWNFEEKPEDNYTRHVKPRLICDYIQKNISGWKLIRKIDNRFKFDPKDPNNTSLSDFFIYQKEETIPEFIITLTSYSKRIEESCHIAIKSLLNQSEKADKIILWLSDKEKASDKLLALEKENKEFYIKHTKDIKSYKKLIPALKEYPNACLITVDDDLEYDKDFIKDLKESYFEDPFKISCHRIYKITFRAPGKVNHYHAWNRKKEAVSNPENERFLFPTTGGGILYPPNSFSLEVFNEAMWVENCPTGDDIWFWAMARLAGNKFKPSRNPVDRYKEITNSVVPLWNINIKTNNDQIEKILNKYPILLDLMK